MSVVAPVLRVIIFLLLPAFWSKLAFAGMSIKIPKRHNEFFTMIFVEGTVEFEFNIFAFFDFEGLGALIRTLIFVLFDAVDTLGAKVLFAGTSTDTRLLSDVVADDALVLRSLFCCLYKGFRLEGFHAIIM